LFPATVARQSSAFAAETPGPAETVVRQMLETISKLHTTKDNVQKTQLIAKINDSLALDSLSRNALGAQWSKLDRAERAHFASLLRELLQKLAYPEASVFFTGLNVQFGVEQNKGGAQKIVPTTVKRSEGGAVSIDYVLGKFGSNWRVVDIVLDGQSLAANVSAQIQALEADIGVELFQRTRRSVKLTTPGEAFLREAEAILQMTENARLRTQRIAAGEAGHLRIGFVASAALEIVPSIVLAFRRSHPRVTLDLLNIRTTEQIALLEDRKLDAGFLRLPASSRELTITPIHTEPFVLVVPRGHRLAKKKTFTLEELEHESFVAYARRFAPGFHDRWVQMFTAVGFSPTIVQETGEMETLLALVGAGVGVAVAPRGLVQRQMRALVIKPLPSNAPQSEIGLAIRSGHDWPLTNNLLQLALALGKKPLS